MWIAGDLVFLVAILAVVVGWMRPEERETRRAPTRRADAELAEIRSRERRLAERSPGSERETGRLDVAARQPSGGTGASPGSSR